MAAVACPLCGSLLVLRDNRWHCPKCDYFKQSYGKRYWEHHANNVSALLHKLEAKFPQVTWKTGLGAVSSQRLDLPPENKGEPDITGWWMRRHFVSIEVSGSIFSDVPPGEIWVRPDKVIEAQRGKVAYFFYMSYPNGTYVLPLSTVLQFSEHQYTACIRGLDETYITIPHNYALSEDALYTHVAQLLRTLEPRLSLEGWSP